MFTNLLENAAKFSSESSSISVLLSQDINWFSVKVQDKGKGIVKEDIPRVFEGFYKGKNSNQESGMGLGLYLAKNIVDKHRGNILITSSLGMGTTVEVKLPKVKHEES